MITAFFKELDISDIAMINAYELKDICELLWMWF